MGKNGKDARLVHIKALQPSKLFDGDLNLQFFDEDSALSATEQLYTPRGSQGIGAAQNDADIVGINLNKYTDTLLITNEGFSD